MSRHNLLIRETCGELDLVSLSFSSALAELASLLNTEHADETGKRNDLYQKIIDLPGRSKAMKELAETLKTLVSLERQNSTRYSRADGRRGCAMCPKADWGLL